MTTYNFLRLRPNWMYLTLIFFSSWIICLVCLFLMANNLETKSVLELENKKLEKSINYQAKQLDSYKQTIIELDGITDTKTIEVDSLKNEILLKENDTKFIHIYDEKIKYINRYSVSDMQSTYNELFSAKE